ncbi:MAG: hypothetical protein RSA79_01520 [Oscillospiraceae bacterium]
MNNSINDIKNEMILLIKNNIQNVNVANEFCEKNAYCYDKPLICVHLKKIEIKPNSLSNFLESDSKNGITTSTLGKNATIFLNLTVTSKISSFECETVCNQLIDGLLFGDTFEADSINCTEISFNQELEIFKSELCISLEKMLTTQKNEQDILSCNLSVNQIN